jgi:hypothetical protein
MRVSDSERAEVTNALCRHFGDGRLDDQEFNERQARAVAAKTQADLVPLLADLPRLPPVTPAPRSSRSRQRAPRIVVGVLMFLVFAWSVEHAVTHVFHPQVPWALIVIVALLYFGWHRRAGRCGDRS